MTTGPAHPHARTAPLGALLLAAALLGCEHDGSSSHNRQDDPPQGTTSTTAGREARDDNRDPQDALRACLPEGQAVPLDAGNRSVDATNSTIVTVEVNPVYIRRETVSTNHTVYTYADGTVYLLESLSTAEEIDSSNALTRTSTLVRDEMISFINGTRVTASLVEHVSNDVTVVRQFDAFAECRGEDPVPVSERSFHRFLRALGLE